VLTRLTISPVILLLIISLPFPVSAERIIEYSGVASKPCDRAVCDDVCELIKNDLERGVDAKVVTRTNILLGNNACFVIKCVLDGGAELKPVIDGAMEAGCMPDVVSRCCLDAGVNPVLVARALRSMAEPVSPAPPGDETGPEDFVPPISEPPETSEGGTISPSSF
jgi:hypothetical protein